MMSNFDINLMYVKFASNNDDIDVILTSPLNFQPNNDIIEIEIDEILF